MQSNTVEIDNQPINFASIPVENRTPEPFTVVDGRYVGHDGFVVPKDFDEFHERFPQYVRNWVKRHVDRSAPREDVEDWAQDLLIHLRYLPVTSKHREAGKQDIVQTFDPRKHYGANQARFQSYINLCLTNKFRTLRSKRMKDALFQPGNVSLDTQGEWNDPSSVNDEYCHSHSEQLQRAANASEKLGRDRAYVAEFLDFTRREDPNALSAVEALCLAQTQGAAARSLGMTEAQFNRTRNRLLQLARCFLTGEPAPKQRKPYKQRVNRNQTVPLPETSVLHLTRRLVRFRIELCKGGDDLDQTFAGAAPSESTAQGSLTVGG
jgi:hypothetical protein